MNRLHHWLCGSAHWQRTMEQRLPWILSGAELGSDVLEIGPGPGHTTELLRRQAPRLTAIEADPVLAERLRQRLGAGVQVVTGNAAEMPFPDCAFTGCAVFTMLHHVPSMAMQDAVLSEIARVLRPGGELAGCDSLTSFTMRLIHIGDTYVPVNPATLPARLCAAGFEDVRVEMGQGFFRFHARRADGKASLSAARD
jgi:ubiquinone/menaquinone biosynthesis C-methylase UbiE